MRALKTKRRRPRGADVRTKNDGGLLLIGRADFIQAAAGEPDKTPRFNITAYTGVPLNQGGMGWMAPVIVDQEGWVLGDGVFPILDEHGGNPFKAGPETLADYVCGQSDYAAVEGKGTKSILRLKGQMIDVTRRAKKIIALAKKKFSFQASIGARVIEKEFFGEDTEVEVNGVTHTGPCYVARKTVLRELSICVLGDDKNTETIIARSPPMPTPKSKTKTRKTSVRSQDKSTILRAADSFEAYCKSEYDMEASDMSSKMKARVKAEYEDKDDDDDVDASDDDDVDAADDDDVDADDDAPPPKVKGKVKGKVKADVGNSNDPDTAAARATLDLRSTYAAETRRMREISEICASAPGLETEIKVKGKPVKVVICEHAITAGWDSEKTRTAFQLAELRAARPTSSSPHFYSPTAPIMTEAVVEAAILQAGGCKLQSNSFYFDRGQHREERRVSEDVQASTQLEMKSRYTDQVMQAAHTHFGKGGIGLHQVLTVIAAANGYRGRETINDGNLAEVLRCAFGPSMIRGDGASLMSAPNVFANVLNKMLLQGYLSVNQSWKEICGIRPVKDFKPTKSINVFGDFVFKKLNADGQITNAAMTDQAFANQVDTFARKLGIGRQQIINDDLSALTTVPVLMGIGSADAISILVWTLWNSPGNAGDGNAFWYARSAAASVLGGGAANSNLVSSGASSALSSESLQSAVQLFDKQVKPNGQPLGVEPAILLYPPELDQTAWELMNSKQIIMANLGSTSSAKRQPSDNRWFGRFRPVKSPYLSNTNYTGYSTTAWWLLAEPGRIPTIEVAFLNGQETPTVMTVQMANQGNELGITVLGYHDFGAAMQNYLGGVKSPGA